MFNNLKENGIMKKLLWIALLLVFVLISCGGEEEDDDWGNDGDGGNGQNQHNEDKYSEINLGSKTRILSVAVGNNDKIYMGGGTDVNLYGELVGETSNAFLAAFNEKGENLWGKQWGNNNKDTYIVALLIDKQNNIYAIGGTYHNVFVSKFSSEGVKIWENFPEIKHIASLTISDSGNLYVGSHYEAAEILKYSPEGQEIWRHKIYENQTIVIEALAVDSEENIYVGGYTSASLFAENVGGHDAVLIKIAPDGTQLWGKQWGSTKDDEVKDLLFYNNNIYVAGRTSKQAEILVKFSTEGDKIWGVEGNNINYSSMTSDGANYIYVNTTLRNIDGAKDCIYKYNLEGESVWNSNDLNINLLMTEIAVDTLGNLYVVGENSLEENSLIKIPASEIK